MLQQLLHLFDNPNGQDEGVFAFAYTFIRIMFGEQAGHIFASHIDVEGAYKNLRFYFADEQQEQCMTEILSLFERSEVKITTTGLQTEK